MSTKTSKPDVRRRFFCLTITSMCRYGSTRYKPHYACFSCRKSFKRRLQSDVDPGGVDRPSRCPQCRGEMASMGLDFKPPAQSKKKEWSILEELWTVGETFHSCGCGGPGYRPRSRRDYARFLDEILVRYKERLGSFSDGGVPIGSRKRDAIDYWRTRVAHVEAAIGRCHTRA